MDDSKNEKSHLFQRYFRLNRRILIILIPVILMTGIVIAEYVILKNLNKNNDNKPAVLPKKMSNSDIIKWNATIDPKDIPKEKQSPLNSNSEDTLIRVQGTLAEILTPNITYALTLSSGEIITVDINDNTFLGKALYGSDKNGLILSVNFTPISRDNLSVLKTGQLISIGYYKKSYIPNQNISLIEFVLL